MFKQKAAKLYGDVRASICKLPSTGVGVLGQGYT